MWTGATRWGLDEVLYACGVHRRGLSETGTRTSRSRARRIGDYREERIVSTDGVQQGPQVSLPAPRTLADALARFNMTTQGAWDLAVHAMWGFCADGSELLYEYDQGDTLVVDYDDLYNLASVALAAMKLLVPNLG